MYLPQNCTQNKIPRTESYCNIISSSQYYSCACRNHLSVTMFCNLYLLPLLAMLRKFQFPRTLFCFGLVFLGSSALALNVPESRVLYRWIIGYSINHRTYSFSHSLRFHSSHQNTEWLNSWANVACQSRRSYISALQKLIAITKRWIRSQRILST